MTGTEHRKMKLHPVDNDIGAPELFCGPTVICAITGKPLSEVLAVIKDKREHFARDLERHRCDPALVSKAAVLASGDETSTSTLDLEDAFTTFDSFLEHAAAFKDKSGPTLRDWVINDDYLTDEILTQYREGAALIFSIGQGDFGDPVVGHWVVITGGEFVDTSTDGKPIPLDGPLPYLDVRVDGVHIVTVPDLEAEARFFALWREQARQP